MQAAVGGGGKRERETEGHGLHTSTDVSWTVLGVGASGSSKFRRVQKYINLGGKLVPMSWATGFLSLRGRGMLSCTPVYGLAPPTRCALF